MKQIVYICDKCKKKVSPEKVVEFENELDFCWECWDKAKEVLKAWTKEPTKKKEESKPKKKAELDAGKAQALRDAGWTITKIADELGTSKTMIHAITTKPTKKKQYENEWAEHEPDLSLQTRIDMGEEHLEDA